MNGATLIILESEEVDQTWSLRRIAEEAGPLGWGDEFTSAGKTMDHIEKTINDTCGPVYVPLKRDIFNAFHWCPLANVKGIIMGMDPYETLLRDGTPQAIGASFSLRREAPLQPSIRNIYKEIASHDPNFIPPDHGDLRGWAYQGVLLLNACLTTKPGVSGAHGKIWNCFLMGLIKKIRETKPHAFVMLWGNDAQTFAGAFAGMKILTTSHPSGRSAFRGFFGCDHFRQANEHLVKHGITPINWGLL